MRKTAISVTEAARNFADCIDRVRYQNASFVLEKNGESVAQLVPSAEKSCNGPQLAAALAEVRLSADERRALVNDRLMVAAVTVAELYSIKWASATHKTARSRYLEESISLVAVLPYTEQTAYEDARIWAQLEASGKMIEFYDATVAATALERNAAVATFNKRHFARVSGLKIIEPALPGR